MAEYSYNEIMKMQNDALRRVNEMQQKARNVKKPQTQILPPQLQKQSKRRILKKLVRRIPITTP